MLTNEYCEMPILYRQVTFDKNRCTQMTYLTLFLYHFTYMLYNASNK